MTDTTTTTPTTDTGDEQSSPDGRSLTHDERSVTRDEGGSTPPSSDELDVRTVLYWGAVGVLSLFAVVALVRFYSSAGAAIDLWVEPKYQPIMQAAFNLVVLLCAGAGISRVARELV